MTKDDRNLIACARAVDTFVDVDYPESVLRFCCECQHPVYVSISMLQRHPLLECICLFCCQDRYERDPSTMEVIIEEEAVREAMEYWEKTKRKKKDWN